MPFLFAFFGVHKMSKRVERVGKWVAWFWFSFVWNRAFLGIAYIRTYLFYFYFQLVNVPHGRVDHTGELTTFAKPSLKLLYYGLK